MLVLGIESSCDETAVAVVSGSDPKKRILSNIVLSQNDKHEEYGGVVPEIAARSHLEHIHGAMKEAVNEAGINFDQLDGIAATAGPGLIGGVIVGLMAGKAASLVHNTPFLAVNHLEGHALTVRLLGDVSFPYLLLLVSGGHTQLLIVKGVGEYSLLGSTLDDAAGEAFDKVAKMIGFGYPGAAKLEDAAKNGDPTRFVLPRPMAGRPNCDFSFSGLKTAVRNHYDLLIDSDSNTQDLKDLCASFQRAISETICDRSQRAIDQYKSVYPEGNIFVLGGGVAANKYLCEKISNLANENNMVVKVPPSNLCTDNGAMIAWAGLEYLRLGKSSQLDFAPRPRWPLDESIKR